MRLKPIPRKCLGNECSIFLPQETDMWGKSSEEVYLLKNVHIQQVNQYINSNNKQIILSATIFVDYKNSVFDKEMLNSLTKVVRDENKKVKVVYNNGEEHYINSVDILPNLDGEMNPWHHLEISVI